MVSVPSNDPESVPSIPHFHTEYSIIHILDFVASFVYGPFVPVRTSLKQNKRTNLS